MALTFTPLAQESEHLPNFSLTAVDGSRYSDQHLRGAKASLVMFICNHCPYVKAIESRLIELGHDLKKLGVPVLAISSNDPTEHFEDSFEELKKRAELKGYTFPYLFDESQEVAKKFGAVCTPDFFVYNSEGILSYRGRLDDSWKDESRVTRRELLSAVQKILGGEKDLKKINSESRPSMGCSIKWRHEATSENVIEGKK